jgi:uncharacterized protein YcfJ
MILTPRHALVVAVAVASGAASAQYRDDYAPAYASGQENVSYAYAQVTRVDPIYETVRTRMPEEVCGGEEIREVRRSNGGTVVGALVGAALGNTVGSGDGRQAATVAGAVIGGAIGRNSDKNNERVVVRDAGCRVVDVEREQRRVASFDVEYVHQGQTYMSRLPYDPGDRLRVRVAVTPVDEGTAYR